VTRVRRFEHVLTQFDSGGLKFRLMVDIHGATQHVAPHSIFRL
jgi:hypothetical protein